MNEIRIGICQLKSEIGSSDYDPRPDNLARALDAIDEVAAQGAQLLVFGEIYLNGYETGEFTPRYAVAEEDDDPFVAPLVAKAHEHGVVILMGATTHKGPFPGDVYNSVLVIGPNGLLGVYSKTHVAAFLFDGDKVAGEKVYWSPGSDLPVFDTPFGRIGVEICYDIWFPEVARTLALKGAELIINVSAAVCGFEDAWTHILYARSLENVIPYLHVSVVGHQKNFTLFGGSRLYGPAGETLFEAPRNEEARMVFTLNKRLIFEARGTLHPFYNRNPRLYQEITQIVPAALEQRMVRSLRPPKPSQPQSTASNGVVDSRAKVTS